MPDKRYISASELSLYSFCPRAWALKMLDYESDNQWEMEKGEEYHRAIGSRELQKEMENRTVREKNSFLIHVVSVLIIIIVFCLISIFLRLILK